jgi:hypothetical protein
VPAALTFQDLRPADRRAVAALVEVYSDGAGQGAATVRAIHARLRAQASRDARARPKVSRLLRKLRAKYRRDYIDLATFGPEACSAVFGCGLTESELMQLGVICSQPSNRFNC